MTGYRTRMEIRKSFCGVHRLLCRQLIRRKFFTMTAANDKSDWPLVAVTEIEDFITRCAMAAGARYDHAALLAKNLRTADQRGHYSHGLNRLQVYVKDLKARNIASEGQPEVINETPATAWVAGNNLLGPVVGKYCMDLAIKKAKETGIGWVVAKNSSHFGIAGWYTLMAADENMVGMAFTNASPLVFPTRSKQAALGTNPISVAAPAENGDSFVLDMATSTVANGKVELAARKGTDIPKGWACDAAGEESTDPSVITRGGGLFPLGGTEECGGYKGYGLGFMVELFSTVLSGATVTTHGRQFKTFEKPADLGHCFAVINPGVFAPNFNERLQGLIDDCRSKQPANGFDSVLIAGDPEREHVAKCNDIGGIPYHPNQISHANEVAAALGLAPVNLLS